MSDVGKLTIPLFVGTVANWGLLGALVVQVYIYYLAFPKDRLVSKIVVALVRAYPWLPYRKRGPDIFAWRIYIIAKSLYVPVIIAIVTIFQLGAGIWTGVDIIRARVFSQFRLLIPPEAWLSATAACDLIIVAGMVFYLLKAKQPEFRTKTKATLSRIIKLTVETGVLCALSALADLYLFVAFDGNNYHLGVCIWLSKVYSNSILVILNSRAHIGHDVVPPGGTDRVTRMTDVAFHSFGDPVSTMQGSVQAINITGDGDSNVATFRSRDDVVKHHLEMV
ncbi:hypothetical protein MSAN_01725800 [Mycena sanguinolenta]|uniref:DUF6534 domain-containing protein n=1 Tax=Mycena sanguinolenta TaxID=230812 RepID=A0A8H7CT75_9AGAR|nr:hypothetical protein MSAN_01725800 [Mycena sanguinolenta]